ncbi:subtilisin-like serine protease QhpE [Acetobacter nitrogenifigens]|nr:S8 family serine peptidase [Acetobacter nitrogenifigens]
MRTGAGIRIAVIDSGVQSSHPHIDATRLCRGVGVLPDGGVESGSGSTVDQLGHGTAVMAAIQEKAPDALCVPIRVFRTALRTSAAALVSAIRWAVSEDVDLINLSLGSLNPAHEAVLALAVREAREGGVTVISAAEAGGCACYPGALPSVIGVTLDWDIPRSRYQAMQAEEKLTVAASGYPRPIPGVPSRRNLHGVSFAVAQVTGFAALIAEGSSVSRDFCALRKGFMAGAAISGN